MEEKNTLDPRSVQKGDKSSKLNNEELQNTGSGKGESPGAVVDASSGKPLQEGMGAGDNPTADIAAGDTAEKPGAKPDKQVPEKPGGKSDKQAAEKPGAKPDKQVPEKPGGKSDKEAVEKPGAKPDRETEEALGGTGSKSDKDSAEQAGGKDPESGVDRKDSESGVGGKDSESSAGGKDSESSAGGKDSESSAGGKSGGQKKGKEKEVENTLEQVSSDQKKTSGKEKRTSYEEKITRHKRRLYRRTLILVALVTILLMTGIILWMRRGYRSAELGRVATFTVEDGAEFVILGKNIVRYSGSGAVCMDRRGNTLWSVPYEMQQPITSVKGDVIAIANRSGYNVYVMNTRGLMGTIETMLPIHSIAAAENGEVAVVMNDSKATWVRLYTAEGREIAYIIRTMAESGYPISVAVSPDGETMCLSNVQMSNAAVKSNVSFYNFGKSGQQAADHRVDYSDFIDEVVPYVEYMDDSTCAGISDKRLILFRKTLLGKSGSSSILFSENIQGVFSSDSFIGLLFNNTEEDEQYRLDIYNKRGKKAGSVSFTMQYKDIKISGDKIYINNEQQCQIFTLGGRCLFDGEFGRSINALVPGTGLSDLLVVTGGEIDSVRLH